MFMALVPIILLMLFLIYYSWMTRAVVYLLLATIIASELIPYLCARAFVGRVLEGSSNQVTSQIAYREGDISGGSLFAYDDQVIGHLLGALDKDGLTDVFYTSKMGRLDYAGRTFRLKPDATYRFTRTDLASCRGDQRFETGLPRARVCIRFEQVHSSPPSVPSYVSEQYQGEMSWPILSVRQRALVWSDGTKRKQVCIEYRRGLTARLLAAWYLLLRLAPEQDREILRNGDRGNYCSLQKLYGSD